MNETLLLLLAAAGGIVTAQNAIVGLTTGSIDARSIKVVRSDRPALFWFVLGTEVLFVAACLWVLIGWLTGTFRITEI